MEQPSASFPSLRRACIHKRKETSAMAKVFGIHEIELRPGVKEEDFERFIAEEAMHLPPFQGWTFSFAKADRGVRTGKYAVIFEIESVAARNRYAPESDTGSEEAQQ